MGFTCCCGPTVAAWQSDCSQALQLRQLVVLARAHQLQAVLDPAHQLQAVLAPGAPLVPPVLGPHFWQKVLRPAWALGPEQVAAAQSGLLLAPLRLLLHG
jgi:hypothetical protein